MQDMHRYASCELPSFAGSGGQELQGFRKSILKYKEGARLNDVAPQAACTSGPVNVHQCECCAHAGLELGSSDEDVCPTCLDPYTDGAHAAFLLHAVRTCRCCQCIFVQELTAAHLPVTENPAIETKCHHKFHLACIFEWLERSKTCPVCSRKMEFEELL